MGVIKKQVIKVFKNISKDVSKAETIALNRAAKTALSRTLRYMRDKYNIPANVLSKLFRITRATKNDQRVIIYAFKQPVAFFLDGGSKRLFGVRQTKKGVSFTRKRGHKERLDSAFIQTMKSGHVGVFVRTGQKEIMSKGSYEGETREKISQLFAIDPAKLLVPESSNTELIDFMNKVFVERLQVEFDRALHHGK
jgi:hypothetical protein